MAHNGWKNYETWLAVGWIDNNEDLLDKINALVARIADGRRYDDLEDWRDRAALIDGVTELVEVAVDYPDVIDQMPDGLLSNLLSAGWGEIDWRELAKSYTENAAEEAERLTKEESA